MAELIPKSDEKEYQDISENFKNIVEEHGNIEAHEMFMITAAFQSQTCYHHATPWTHICSCGQANPGANDEVKEEVFKHVMNCFENTHDKRICF